MKKSFYFYTSIALSIILGLIIGNYIFGWTIPTANPPSSNLPAPIHTGSSKQPKEGYLAVGTTTTPAYPLEVVGTMQVWGQLISKVASGTTPFVVNSPTKVANLNVDLLDGYDSSDLLGGGTVWGFSAPPGNCAPYNDCDGDGKTAFTGDCDETCATCYVGSTAYTTSPDGLDQDCDGRKDEIEVTTCTPLYGDLTVFGWTTTCGFTSSGIYKYTGSNPAQKVDSTHCVKQDVDMCTDWNGGYKCSVAYHMNYQVTGNSISCEGTTWYDNYTSSSGKNAYYERCYPMIGCTKTNQYY